MTSASLPPRPMVDALWLRFLIGCFLVILGCRVFLVHRFGASVAQVDEWEATGWEILAAWNAGTLDWRWLFQAHNGDHRIFFTRLWEIFWFEVNGAWDPKLVMTAKCALYATAATLFTHLLSHRLGAWRFGIAAVLALLFAMPFGYQNMLWAFQSQFDFFLLAAALGWTCLLRGRIMAALVIAALSPLALGAGPVIAASYVPYLMFRGWLGRRNADVRAARGVDDGSDVVMGPPVTFTLRRTRIACVLALAIAGGAAALRAPTAAPIGEPTDQVRTLAGLMGWPASNLVLLVERLPESSHLFPRAVLQYPTAETSWLLQLARFLHAHPGVVAAVNTVFAAALVLPLLLLARAVWRGCIAFRRAEAIFAIGGFGLLLLLATAFARARQTSVPARFVDVVVLLGFACIASLPLIAQLGPRVRRIIAVWLLLFVPSYAVILAGTFGKMSHHLPTRWVANTRAYYAAQDRTLFPSNDSFALPILEKDPTFFYGMMERPEMRAILPWSVTQPEKTPPWPARIAAFVALWGWLLAILGACLAFAAAWRSRRASRQAFAPLPDATFVRP